MTALPAELNAQPLPNQPHSRYIVVDDNGEPVRVHWHYKRGPKQPRWRWHCSACGGADHAHACNHTYSAALLLAEQLLGLATR